MLLVTIVLVLAAAFAALVVRGVQPAEARAGEVPVAASPSGTRTLSGGLFPSAAAPEYPAVPPAGFVPLGEVLFPNGLVPALPGKSTEPPSGLSPSGNETEPETPGVPVPETGYAVSFRPAVTVERPPVESRGSLSFVIDDAGNNLRDLEPFLSFPGPLTITVLPGLPHSAEAARRIRAAGKEVFLHQPMESLGGTNPGPGAIWAGMSGDEIRAIVSRNLDEIWPVAGINNHEGSRVTMDETMMETVLALCRERGILFLDSRTTAESAVPGAARRLGIVIGERDVFVDNLQDRDSMIHYINNGLQKAGRKGSAILIGHVWSPGLAPLLAELFPDLEGQGYVFSPVSTIINGKQP